MIQTKKTSKAFSCFLLAFLNNKHHGDFGLYFSLCLLGLFYGTWQPPVCWVYFMVRRGGMNFEPL